MRLQIVVVALVLVGLVAPSWADTQEPYIAESPQQIRPLMVGAHVPDVTLATPDHQRVVLRDVLAQQPTILIYYRGGW